MNRRAASLALITMALGGCQDGSSDGEALLKQSQLHWETLKDGSQFARVDLSNGERSEAIRCWPGKVGQFECLRAGELNAAGINSTTVVKTVENTLPTRSLAVVLNGDGYSCSYVIGYAENIQRGGAELVSNHPDYGRPAWSRGYVERYMTANDVKGTRYFRCLDVLEAVNRGSLETLSTTSVTKSMLK